MGVPNTTHENVNFPGDGSQYSSKRQENLKSGDYFIDDQERYWEYKYITNVPWHADFTQAFGTIDAYYGWELVEDNAQIDRLRNKPGHTLVEDQRTQAEIDAENAAEAEAAKPLSIGPIGGKFNAANAYRWPLDMIDDETDWVLFQFGKYPKPFGRDVQDLSLIHI